MGKANITIFHPNSDGKSGSAIRAEMHYQTDDKPGFIRLKIADQDGVEFDFDKSVAFDLPFVGVASAILVLNGTSDSLNPIESGEAKLAMKRAKECVAIAIVDGDMKSKIILNRQESAAISHLFDQSMFFLAFIKGVNP